MSPLPFPYNPEDILERLGVAILIGDLQSGVVRYANQQCAKLLAYEQAKLNNGDVKCMDIVYVDDRSKLAEQHRRLLGCVSTGYECELRLLPNGGPPIPVHVVTTTIKDPEGRPHWTAAVFRELTALRDVSVHPSHVDAALQLSNAEALAGLITWAWEAETETATTLSRSGSSSSCGVPRRLEPETLRSMLAYVHPDDRKAVECTIKRAISNGSGYAHEYRVIRRDGQIRWMRGIANCLFDDKGSVTHLVGATFDITVGKRRSANKRVPEPIKHILMYVEKNLDRELRLYDLARRNGITPRAVQRYFASRGSTSFSKYVKVLRLRRAYEKLNAPSSRTSVSGVAISCGFQNPSHFSRDYRAEFGELPSETLSRANRRTTS